MKHQRFAGNIITYLNYGIMKDYSVLCIGSLVYVIIILTGQVL